TVYGLGSRAVQADVAALAAMKGRTASKPFLLLISDRGMAEANGLAFNASADALARAFWPGPLTLVLPGGSGRLPDLLRGPDGGIAVRWTSHRGIAHLVAAMGGPLTSTSANLPGQPPGPGADAIARDFAGPVAEGRLAVLDGARSARRAPPPGPGAAAIARDVAGPVAQGRLLVLDGGVLGNRPPSTVVDCTKPRPEIVREGTLSVHELRRAVGRLAPRFKTSCSSAPATSAAARSPPRCSGARSRSAPSRSRSRRPGRARGTVLPPPRARTSSAWSGASTSRGIARVCSRANWSSAPI